MLALHAYREGHVDTTTTADRWGQRARAVAGSVCLCSSSPTCAVHILTRSLLGGIKVDNSQNGAENVAGLFFPLLSPLTDRVSLILRPLFCTTVWKVRCDTMAGSDDLAFPPMFGMHRHNFFTTWLSCPWHLDHWKAELRASSGHLCHILSPLTLLTRHKSWGNRFRRFTIDFCLENRHHRNRFLPTPCA